MATLAVLLLAQAAGAKPVVSFPFNSQLPLAARVGQFYSYSFSASTFASGPGVTYSLDRHPSWLSIESSGRRLYGLPADLDLPPGAVVGQAVEIVATDDSGSTTMNATLVVTENPPPSVHIPLASQIAGFGNFSAPSSLLAYPSTDFAYSFDSRTFGDDALNYYATSGDSSPLPAWVKFDAASLTFSGRTPPFKSLIQPPQTFDFNLVASDIVGFSAASLSFSIVVGSHKLTTDHPVVTLDAAWGSELTYSGFEDKIQLDGKPVGPRDLSVTTAGLPGWLSYDAETRRLRGTPSQGDHSTNFTISFHDRFSDHLDVVVVVNVASSLFKTTPDNMDARPGANFQVDLAKYFRNPDDVQVKVTTSPDQDWLTVHGLELAGQVPVSATGRFDISIEAVSKSSGVKETQAFGIVLLARDGSTTTTAAPTSTGTRTQTTDQTQSHSETADAAEPESGHLSTGKILLATIVPIIFISLLFMLFVCFFRRRRRRSRPTYLSGKYRAKISRPLARSFRGTDSDPSTDDIERTRSNLQVGRHLFKPAKARQVDVSPLPFGQPSSETLGGSSDADVPRPLLAGGGRAATIRSVGSTEIGDGAQSWVTVEGEDSGRTAESASQRRSHNSDTTFPESTHQILPPPAFLSERGSSDFRSGLDMTIPMIEDFPSMQATPVVAYRPSKNFWSRQSLGSRSAVTCSSAALPSMLEGGQRANAGPASNWETIAESETGDDVSELRKPDRAQLRSRPDDSNQWDDAESSTASKVLGAEVSFESSENWRVIGPRNGAGASYTNLVNDSPFHPSRSDLAADEAPRGGGGSPEPRPGRAPEMEPLSPSKWGDDVHATTTRRGVPVSVASTWSDDDRGDVARPRQRTEAGAAGKGEHPGHDMPEKSESYTAFV